MHPRPPYPESSTWTEPTLADVEALGARRHASPDRPDLAGMDLAQRWTVVAEHRNALEDLLQEVFWLSDALRIAAVPMTDPRRVAAEALYAEVYALVGRAQRHESAAENAFLRNIGQGADVDRRLQARRRIFSDWRRPRRDAQLQRRPRAKPRRRGAGRPRAQVSRSSARSGDSGDDGPAGHQRREDLDAARVT